MMPDLSPELKILYMQYDLQRKEFSELLTQKNEMLMYEEQYLTALYLNAVGQLQHQKFCLNVEIKMLVQRIQLMQSYINKNKYPDKQLIEQKIQQHFDEYLKKIALESEQLIVAKKYLTESSFLPAHIAQKIKEVYKTIVKKLHPDINPNVTDEEKDLLLKAQAAYDMSNLDALNAILLSMDMKTPSVAYNPEGIKEQLAKLEVHVAKLKSQVEELEGKFPFSFRNKLADERWIEAEQESLEADITALMQEKNKYTEYLLLMEEWKPQLLN
jgi:hypothetical protein